MIERFPAWFEERWIAGICSAIACHQGWSIAAVRLFFIVFTLLSFGWGACAYAILWIVMPVRRP